MRILFFLLTFLLCAVASATDYYISTSGNDISNTGLSESSPWRTIDKVNSVFPTLKPGDRILFRRGEKFRGSVRIMKDGTAGSPIALGAYGSGERPLITGLISVSAWNNEGNGIYSTSIQSEARTNMVLIDGFPQGMGRWPDIEYNIFESAFSNTSITDDDLPGTTDWTGAEAVIRKNDWSLDRCQITSGAGKTITYSNLGTTQNATAKYGYFIQNDLRCLTSYGEWYHDTLSGKLYIYFGSTDPNSRNIEVATVKTLLVNNGFDYITLDDIRFSGSISHGITCTSYGSNNFTIKNCVINYTGQNGIEVLGNYSAINNNLISDCNQTGINVIGDYSLISDNQISNIGLIPGLALEESSASGIRITNNHCEIKNNRIENVGHCGITMSSTADIVTIKNNFINNALLVLNDGAGIYISGEGTSRTFDGNIIMNVQGNTNGTSYPTRYIARGIYLDINSTNVAIINNTVANCTEGGYMVHKAHENRFENNTSFNNGIGMFLQNTSGSDIRNIGLFKNIFFAKEASQLSMKLSSATDDLLYFGTADYNFYARPIDDNEVIGLYSPSTGTQLRNLAGWQSFSDQDRNSKKSVVTISDTSKIDFYCNPSTSNKVISLGQPMVDVTGKKYTGSVTLLPFTSVILMPDPNPYTPAVPAFTGATVENSTPTVVVMSYSINLATVIPASSAFTVTVNGTPRTVSSVSVSGNKVSLTLSSRVNYGDLITLSYTKPSASPLQTSEGAQAASLISQTVKNNCATPVPTPTPTPTPVPSNKPPVISIASPVKGSSYTTPINVVIEVTAYDPDGSIESVILYNGNTVLGERTSVPFSFTLKDLEVGSYTIHAVAIDNLKSSATSAALEFHVTAPEPEKGALKLYPNPNNGQFSIDYAAPEGIENYTLSVINTLGRTVMVEELSQNQYMKQYDLSHIMSGTYIVMISTDKILLTQKFIKK